MWIRNRPDHFNYRHGRFNCRPDHFNYRHGRFNCPPGHSNYQPERFRYGNLYSAAVWVISTTVMVVSTSIRVVSTTGLNVSDRLRKKPCGYLNSVICDDSFPTVTASDPASTNGWEYCTDSLFA